MIILNRSEHFITKIKSETLAVDNSCLLCHLNSLNMEALFSLDIKDRHLPSSHNEFLGEFLEVI